MNALVLHYPKKVKVDEAPNPAIEDSRHAISKVTSTAISGSDLHIYNGMFHNLPDFFGGIRIML